MFFNHHFYSKYHSSHSYGALMTSGWNWNLKMSISKTMSFTVSIILNVFLPFSMAVLDLHKPLDFPPSGLPDTFVSVQSQFSLNYGSVILSFLGIVLLVTLMKSGPKSNTKTLNTIPRAKGLFTIRIPIIDGIYGMMRARRGKCS